MVVGGLKSVAIINECLDISLFTDIDIITGCFSPLSPHCHYALVSPCLPQNASSFWFVLSPDKNRKALL